ncbi:hypothetical protein NIES2107_60830 [Nostoc carneum NIES-2107]|nr:hypothetical protein NIES2107_60830 [Nostoc carneum NIES-2107]
MAQTDDEVLKLYRRIQELENKVDKLAKINERLAKAEKDILDLGGIIQSLIDDVGHLTEAVGEHNKTASNNRNIFQSIIQAFIEE